MEVCDVLVNNDINVISTFLSNYKFTILVSHPVTIAAVVLLLLLQLCCFCTKTIPELLLYKHRYRY
jgi:hypothetical protein